MLIQAWDISPPFQHVWVNLGLMISPGPTALQRNTVCCLSSFCVSRPINWKAGRCARIGSPVKIYP